MCAKALFFRSWLNNGYVVGPDETVVEYKETLEVPLLTVNM